MGCGQKEVKETAKEPLKTKKAPEKSQSIDVRKSTRTLPPMRFFMLSIVAVCLGCGGANQEKPGPLNGDNNEATGTASKIPASPPTAHTKDSIELIQQRIAAKEAILIDVREQDEWDSVGHLQVAVLLPLSELKAGGSDKSFAETVAKKLPKDKIIYCHCASGGRVMPASAILYKLGYDVRPLKAGYDDLLGAGFKDAE